MGRYLYRKFSLIVLQLSGYFDMINRLDTNYFHEKKYFFS